MNIGEAVSAAKAGHWVRRAIWRDDTDDRYKARYVEYHPAGDGMKAYLRVMCSDGELMAWTPLSWDLLAEDWETCG